VSSVYTVLFSVYVKYLLLSVINESKEKYFDLNGVIFNYLNKFLQEVSTPSHYNFECPVFCQKADTN